MTSAVVCAQVRVHNLNLWLDKDGNAKGDRADATILDAPWTAHAPLLILWAGAEALKASSVHLVTRRLVPRSPALICLTATFSPLEISSRRAMWRLLQLDALYQGVILSRTCEYLHTQVLRIQDSSYLALIWAFPPCLLP